MLLTAAIMIMAGFSTRIFAQDSEQTDAGAKIVSALSITEVDDLHFGTMTIPTGAVELELSTSTVRTPDVPANITLLSQAPVAQNAAYTVAGSANATYAITLPADGVVEITSGANSMDVDDFVAKTASAGIDGTTGTLDGSGADSFVVGATLKLANGQAAGVYTGTFNVSVDYN